MSRGGPYTGAKAYAGPGPQAPAAFVGYEDASMDQPWQNPTRSGMPATDAVNKSRFPAQYIDRDPRDSLYSLKKAVVAGQGTWLGAGAAQAVVPITDADMMYFKHKEEQQEYQNFKIWAEQWYDFSDPAQVRLFEEAFPDYYMQRLTLIQNLGMNAVKYAQLRLLGPRTRDDFMFMWAVQTGRIQMPKGALWDPATWSKEGPAAQLAFFNPWRLTSKATAPNMVDVNNRTDPFGTGARVRGFPSMGGGEKQYYWDSLAPNANSGGVIKAVGGGYPEPTAGISRLFNSGPPAGQQTVGTTGQQTLLPPQGDLG